MSTLEWAAVKEFKPGFKVQDVELGSHDVQRHVTTIKGSSRSTSIVPKASGSRRCFWHCGSLTVS